MFWYFYFITGIVVFINSVSAKAASFCINFFTVAKLVALIIIIIVGVVEIAKGTFHLTMPPPPARGKC